MLITQAFQWVAPFSGWVLVILPVLAVVFWILYNWYGKKTGKIERDDYLGVFGVPAALLTGLSVFVPLIWGLMGIPTHGWILKADVEEQYNISYVDNYWSPGESGSHAEIRGKDADGKFVICKIEDTRSEDTYKLVCDNGKDNWKGTP